MNIICTDLRNKVPIEITSCVPLIKINGQHKLMDHTLRTIINIFRLIIQLMFPNIITYLVKLLKRNKMITISNRNNCIILGILP